MTYSHVTEFKSSATGNSLELDQILLREVNSGRSIELVAQCLAQDYGIQMSSEDALVAYRSAYWRAKSWEKRDNQIMEETVFAEVRCFWERIASTVGRLYKVTWNLRH